MGVVKEILPTGPVYARIKVPGSKSLTNRALICAALAGGESVLTNASDSTDTALMGNGLNQLGVLVRKSGDSLVVNGTAGKLFAPKFPIPVGNAGTTLRFMLSLASFAQGKTVFEADGRMAERPIDDLINGLGQVGVRAEVRGTQYLVHGGEFRGGKITIASDKSSQFVSSLLMVSPYAGNDTVISLSGTQASLSYIEMTLDVMKKFGVEVERSGSASFAVRAGQRYKPTQFTVEADASGASYFLAAAAISGGEVTVEGVRANSVQGDAQFVKVIEKMGCITKVKNDELRVMGGGVGVKNEKLRVKSGGGMVGVDVDMNSMPDVVPTLVVIALFAEGVTRIRNIAHLRYKESDRLDGLITELQKAGADIRLDGDGLEIRPVPLHGAQLDTHDDHRLAMSFALIGLRVPGIKIENPDCVRKSFPTFWREFEKLYERS